MAFADLTANLNLNITNFSSRLSQASKQMNSFARNMQQSYGEAAKALNRHNLQLKDTVRIIHGIVIAQTFYRAAGAITDATRSLWDFNVALDYMHVTYSALFGDTKVASDFMNVLQEHSVETIFDYQNLADASKKLLAYGIEYENLMFIMEGLTNLGAMSGDSAALDRIALALGQIYTKGKLSAEEMRQLANAYIPITEILQDKFGLTGDDLKRVGDLNLPANEVINAIVDYANENFGSVGEAAMYTITGLQNKIVDTLKVVGAQMLTPITTAYKSFLAYVSNGLEVLRSEFEAGGVGGIFEYLVPDRQTQQIIRQFITNVKSLFMSLVSVGVVAGQLFGNFAIVLVNAFNIVAPILTGFINVLAGVTNAILNSERATAVLRVALVAAAGALVVLRVQALASLVITAVTNAVINLSKALMLLATLVSKHPILALLAGLAIAVTGVSVASKDASSSLSNLFGTINGAGGGSLQKTQQNIADSSSALDQFNNRLEEGAGNAEDFKDAMNGAGGAADKAAKKTKGLLSFDEVYKLPEPSESSGGSGGGVGAGVLDSLENLIDGFSGLGGALIPDIPDFSEFINGFTDGLFGGIEKSIFDKLKSSGIGTLIGGGIGAIIGAIIGGPAGAVLGAKIGAFAGGVVGLLWEAFSGALSNMGAGAIAGVGSAIAKAFGGTFSSVLKEALTNPGSISGLFKNIAGIFKGTGAKALLKGGVIGAAIGLVVDGIAHLLWTALDERFENADAETAKVGQTIGSVIGAVIGGLLGGPPGVIIGSAIGTFAGGFVGLFWDPIVEYFDPATNPLSAFFVSVAQDLKTWSHNTLIGFATWWVETGTGFATWFTDTASGFSTWWNDTASGFSSWWEDTKSGFSSWWEDTVATFSDWDSITSETLGDWWSSTYESFSTWWSDTTGGFTTWFEDTYVGFTSWKADTLNSLNTWAAESWDSLTVWIADTYSKFNGWRNSVREIILGWVVDIVLAISGWVTDTLAKFETWKEEAIKVVKGFGIAAKEAIESGLAEMYEKVRTKLSDVKKEWEDKWTSIKKSFESWWSDLGEDMGGWLEDNVWTPISNFFSISNFWTRLSSALDKISEKVSNWWSSVKRLFGGNISFTGNVTGQPVDDGGHAAGGIFNREHIARFAEGNKAEAIIPLENNRAMQPFVDAVANGLVGTLAPMMAQPASATNALPPMYVGTLIADERGLKQLYKKFEVIQLQEQARRGQY